MLCSCFVVRYCWWAVCCIGVCELFVACRYMLCTSCVWEEATCVICDAAFAVCLIGFLEVSGSAGSEVYVFGI